MGALDGLVAVSNKLHQSFGRSFTLRSNVAGAFNPATLKATQTATDTTFKGVLRQYMANEVGGLIEAGDLELTAYLATAPGLDDEVLDGSTVYQIVNISRQYATDDVAYYVLVLRR